MTDAAAPLDDLFATKNPALVAGRRFAWSPKAKPLTSRYNFLNISLFGYVIIQVFAILVLAVMLYMFTAFESDGFEMTPMLQQLSIIAGMAGQYLPFVSIGMTLICVIAYLMFVYRGMSNLHNSNARNLTITPGWAVGYSFIPFVNLAMVYNAMKQIWVASHDPDRGNIRAPITLHLWWGLWLGSNIVNTIADRMMPRDPSLVDQGNFAAAYIPAISVGIGSGIASVLSCFCLMATIRQITTAQETLRSTAAFDE